MLMENIRLWLVYVVLVCVVLYLFGVLITSKFSSFMLKSVAKQILVALGEG